MDISKSVEKQVVLRRLKTYYELTKPGIVYGNAITVVAGFFFAAPPINWLLLVITVVGLSLIVASACVFNNYFDQGIDARMERTKTRGLPAGKVGGRNAIIFGFILGIAGAVLLFVYTNILTLCIALAGLVVYVGLYTPLKRKTGYAVFVGAIAGAVPPVVGYTAVTNSFDLKCLAIFVFLFAWQIGHFLAIAVYRYDEYAAAGVPLLVPRPKNDAQKKLARKVFFYSLVVLLLFCGALMLQRWII